MNVLRVLERLGVEVKGTTRDHAQALCPYHEDHTPSWRIRLRGDRAGLHHCQACKEGGDLVELVRQVRGYANRSSAKEWLEREGEHLDAGDLQVPAVNLVLSRARRAFRMPEGFVREPLAEWVTPAREYALSRGLTWDQIDAWGIGYAVEGKLAGRIVVPVASMWGELQGYMARSFTMAKKRYLYPHESEGADPDCLFGEEHWPMQRSDRHTVVVTEGALKSLAVERALPSLCIAALGGSPVPPRPIHVAKLATFQRVVVLTDSDAPGEAAGDALAGALGRYSRVFRARLAPGKDADSVEPWALRECIRAAVGSPLRRRTEPRS
jgi:DNA primase